MKTTTVTTLEAFTMALNHNDETGTMMIKGVKGKKEKTVLLGTYSRCGACDALANTKADKFYITTK